MAMQLWDPAKDQGWLDGQSDRIENQQAQALLFHGRDPKDAYTVPKNIQNTYRLIPTRRAQKPGRFFETRFAIVTKWKKVPMLDSSKFQDFKAIGQMFPEECQRRGIEDSIQAAQDDLVQRGVVKSHGAFYPHGYRQVKVHVNAVDRMVGFQQNPYILLLPWSVMKQIEPMIHVQGSQGLNIFDVQSGYDILISKSTGAGNKVEYQSSFLPNAKPLANSPQDIEMILQRLFDIDEISGQFPPDKTLEYMAKAAQGMIAFYEAKTMQGFTGGFGQGQFGAQQGQHPMAGGQFQIPGMGQPQGFHAPQPQFQPQQQPAQPQNWGQQQPAQQQGWGQQQPQAQQQGWNQPQQPVQQQGWGQQPAQQNIGSTPVSPGIMFPNQQHSGGLTPAQQNKINGGSAQLPACFTSHVPNYPPCTICPVETQCRKDKASGKLMPDAKTPQEMHEPDEDVPY